MSNELKITFVGGSDHLGDAMSLMLDGPVLVGRSHKAAIRFTKKDGDVSGVHVEIRKEQDGVFAVAVKEFVLNERDTVPCGELRKLAKGDVLTLGPISRAGIRIDALPAEMVEDGSDAPTGETRFTAATGLTRMSRTLATGVTDATIMTAATEVSESAVERPTADPKIGDGETEILDPEKMKDLFAKAGSAPEDPDRPTEILNMPTSGGVTFDGSTTGSGLDRTIPLPSGGGETVVIDPGMLPIIDPDAPKRFRRRLMVFSIFGFAAILGVVIYSRINHSDRFLSHPGFVVSTFKDAAGNKEVDVDYPWGHGSRKDETPTSLKVMTLTGKDRKCPFNLDFSITRDPAQVELSLEAAAEREVAFLSDKGFSFKASDDDGSVSPEERAGFFFFEDQYPQRCQRRPSRGTRFFRREYTVSRNGGSWWGVYIFLRDEDRVYRLFREIPESQKPRGKYLLLYNPNLSIYSTLLDRRWESVGKDVDMVGIDNLGEQMSSVKQLVDGGWAEDWEKVSRAINSMMIATYGKSESVRKPVRELLEGFRKRQDELWRDFENERDKAIRNGDSKGLKSVCQRCHNAFGRKDKRDWRFKRSNDAREWPCEIKAR